MSLTHLIEQGKNEFYELIYKASTAFPHSNALMHIGLIGTLPFLVGRYGSGFLAKHCYNYPAVQEFLQEDAENIGFICSFAAEILWVGWVEPRSKYNHPDDDKGKLYGIMQTGAGAFLGCGFSRWNDYRIARRLEKMRNGILEFRKPRRKWGLGGR